MTNEMRNRHGETIEDVITCFPGELDVDAVGLWQIVPAAETFGLTGEAKVDFIRRSVAGLLEAGAVPVLGSGEVPYEWIEQARYGTSKADIVEAVVAEWLAWQPDNFTLVGGVWFARPNADHPNYVKRV